MPAAKALRSRRQSGASIGSGSAAMCRLQRPHGSALGRARRHSAHFQAKIASDRIKASSSCSAGVKPLRTVQLAVRRCVFQPLGDGITGFALNCLSIASHYTCTYSKKKRPWQSRAACANNALLWFMYNVNFLDSGKASNYQIPPDNLKDGLPTKLL